MPSGISHTNGLIQAAGFIGGNIGPSGQVFFVNYNGGDADDLDVPWWHVDEAQCFSELQTAIDACVADRGDIIWVKAGDSVYEPAATINCNKSGIMIFGQTMGASDRRVRVMIDGQALTGPAFNITKRCHLRGLQIMSKGTAAGGNSYWGGEAICPVVLIDNIGASTDGQGTIIERCLIRNSARADITHLILNKGCPDVEIGYCHLEGHVIGSPSGVIWGGSGDTGPGGGRGGSTYVHHSIFTDVEYAFDMRGVGTENFLLENMCGYYQVGTALVKGLKYPAGGSSSFASNAFLCGNYFPYTAATAHSHSIANLETRGVMCMGNHYAAEYGGS